MYRLASKGFGKLYPRYGFQAFLHQTSKINNNPIHVNQRALSSLVAHEINTDNTSMMKFVSESFIKPKHFANEADHEQKQRYDLGPIDLAMLSLDPMQKGLLFAKPSSHQSTRKIHMETFLKKLKNSLSHSLDYYYPFAGRLETEKFENEHACSIYVDRNKGPGARIIHATALDVTMSDVLSPTVEDPSIVRSFFDLSERSVNHDGHTRPLLSIQVTELFDGIFMGFTVSHSVCDGTTFWNFVSTLSKIFQSLDNNNDGYNDIINIPGLKPPKFSSFLPEGYGPNKFIKLPYLNSEEFIVRYEPFELRERMFHFSKTSMAKLKAKVNAESSTQNVSSFQALSALVWSSITRARNLSLDESTTCVMIANARPRMDPPLSQDYFGNFLTRVRTNCTVGELMDRNLGSVATMMNEEVKNLNQKAVSDFLNYYVSAPFVCQPRTVSAFYEPNNVLLGGSPKLDMYAPEFGFGKAMAIRDGYNNKDDGKLTAFPGREGGGSVELEICLVPESMAALEADEEFMSFVS